MNSVIYFLASSVNILLYNICFITYYPPIASSIHPSMWIEDAFQSTLCHSEDISLNVDSWVPLPETLILKIWG